MQRRPRLISAAKREGKDPESCSIIELNFRSCTDESRDFRPLGVSYRFDWHKALGDESALKQSGRVGQSNTVDKVQAHVAALHHDQAD
jgi:hypothetical protein